MLKKFGIGLLVLAQSLVFVPSLALAATVGTNGSFESGIAPGAYTGLNSGDNTSITDWVVDGGTVDFIGSYWQPSAGNNSLDMNGTSAGSISQTFTTVVGAKYDVTFDLSGNPDGSDRSINDPYYSPSNKVLRVSATGATFSDVSYDTAAVGNTLAVMKWAPQTYSFVATSTSTTLTFASQVSGAFGPALDNVVINETLPVPPTTCGEDKDGEHGQSVVSTDTHHEDCEGSHDGDHHEKKDKKDKHDEGKDKKDNKNKNH